MIAASQKVFKKQNLSGRLHEVPVWSPNCQHGQFLPVCIFSFLCWLILINCVLPWVPRKEFPDRPEIRISEKS